MKSLAGVTRVISPNESRVALGNFHYWLSSLLTEEKDPRPAASEGRT